MTLGTIMLLLAIAAVGALLVYAGHRAAEADYEEHRRIYGKGEDND